MVVAKDQTIPAQCEGTVMGRLERLVGVESGIVEPRPQAHLPKGIYIAQTLVQECQEVPITVLNATHHDQKLARGPPLSYCESVGRMFQAHLLNVLSVPSVLRSPPNAESREVSALAEASPVLGYIVLPKGIPTDPEQSKAMQQWPTPRNTNGIRSFLGICT
jgi:hypothetical protein